MFEFDNQISAKKSLNLYYKYIIPPFSVFDTKSKEWITKRNKWLNLGIKGELGRSAGCIHTSSKGDMKETSYTSIFDPLLCEVIYSWFCPKYGSILDPFAGGSVRGIVASKLEFSYTGIDLRKEQIEENKKQAKFICSKNINYICGDSNIEISKLNNSFDLIFSCPPYFDLEVYSEDKDDLSNMSWEEFKKVYKNIIQNAILKLNDDSFACFVVGDIRDKDGYYRDLPSYTKECFFQAGMNLYNDIILLNSIASASLRADFNFKYKKVTKIHQNVLVFFKGNLNNILNKKYLVSY